MAIEIDEKLTVDAPIDRVWAFVMDPARVVTCMPGASLDEVVDERHFLGKVKVKVGAISASYKGQVEFTDLDPVGRTVQMLAEGRETGGGTAKGQIAMVLAPTEAGPTELAITATIDLTGRVMQVGRGMIQGVSHQLFKQFGASMKGILEAEGEESAAAETAVAAQPQELAVVPLLLRTVWAAITGFFRRIFGRKAD
jgi:carbon monoxide dehydrogenase subunit G